MKKKSFLISLIVLLCMVVGNLCNLTIKAQESFIHSDLFEASVKEEYEDLSKSIQDTYGVTLYFNSISYLDVKTSLQDLAKEEVSSLQEDSKVMNVLLDEGSGKLGFYISTSLQEILPMKTVELLKDNLQSYANQQDYQTLLKSYYRNLQAFLNAPNMERLVHLEDSIQIGFLHDFAGFLSEQEKEEINQHLQNIYDTYHMPIYVQTEHDLHGYETVEDYNEAIFEGNLRGDHLSQDGLQLLIVQNPRKYDITAHGKGNTIFTDYGREKAADVLVYHLRDDNYYQGIQACLDKFEYELRIYQDEGVAYDVDYQSEQDSQLMIIVCFAASLLVGAASVALMYKKMNTAVEQFDASGYMSHGLSLSKQQDIYTHTTTSRRYDPPNKDSTGGGSSINSSGFSHTSGSY